MNEATLMDLILNPDKVPTYVSFAFLASLILIVVALIVRGAMALVPRGIQNVVEAAAEFVLKTCHDSIGEEWGDKFFPLIGTLFMYILLCNYMGLIPGFISPTQNINMTASMAVPIFFATHYYGLKLHGPRYIKHFLGPIRSMAALPLMGFMFIIEIIGHIARPITLSVRLFGNMFAKHLMLGVLGLLLPAVVPVLVLGLGVIVGVLQAYVFALLSILYLSGAVEEAH